MNSLLIEVCNMLDGLQVASYAARRESYGLIATIKNPLSVWIVPGTIR
jgi:hypothetical protein